MVKTDSFVCFLEEFDDSKSPFEIIWPLASYLTKLFCMFPYLTNLDTVTISDAYVCLQKHLLMRTLNALKTYIEV